MAIVREKMFQCHVQRRRTRAAGGYEFFWKVKSVAEAVTDGDVGFRCMDCHGSVKLYNRSALPPNVAHVEHRSANDAEFCSSSIVFQKATDGRVARIAPSPVQFTRR
jgi:hypothetical protein